MATKSTKAVKGEKTFTDAEKEAMKDLAKERKRGKKDGAADLAAKIAELGGNDKVLAQKLHELVTAHAPGLKPTTWYGMPAWAGDNGKAVLFFTPGEKFKERYATLGFSSSAKLDEGNFWPTSYALLKIGPAEEKQIVARIKQAAG
ncbi:MAG: hypothetical protein EOP22_10120 [Hyphomicrobiales bacterium]|nr:MAG: hypothetical protein EOP22_10120 [Hyphomicrobiales bacterium]